MIAYLKGELDCKAILLQGYAGTGKTTTISALVRVVQQLGIVSDIAVSAPTNKAVMVLRKSGSLGNVTYATIHSLFGLKEHTDPKTGKRYFKQNLGDQGARIEEFDLLIIDEVSMLQRANEEDPNKRMEEDVDFYELINAHVTHRGLKLIVMGDPIQIPPVNSPDAVPFDPALREQYGIRKEELTQIMRQASDNPILGYATQLRMEYKTGNVKPITHINEETNCGLQVLVPGEEVGKVLQKLFCSPEFKADADYAKVLAWTNDTVNLYNREIRKMLYGTDFPARYIKGEYLVVDTPVFHPIEDRILFLTSEEGVIMNDPVPHKIVHGAYKLGFGRAPERVDTDIPALLIDVRVQRIEGPVQHRIAVLTDEGEAQFRRLQDMFKATILKSPFDQRKSLWSTYYKNEKRVGWFKYNYALTVHKSQGSTYDNVLMLDWDINKNRKIEERNRIKYVAATRARHMLYISAT